MFTDIGISEIADVACMSVIIYIILVWFMKTRAAFVLTGMIITGLVYLAAQQFGLALTAGVLQGFFAVILVAGVVIFQEEIRRFFEQVAVWGVLGKFWRRRQEDGRFEPVGLIAATAFELAREKIGALIVLRGKMPLAGLVSGGSELDGKVSADILKSIFDPNSSGHDGAVIIEGNKIARFAVHLPLTKNHEKLTRGGTRHAAAIGMSERCDALCIVVSEERGTVSIARGGELVIMEDVPRCLETLQSFIEEMVIGSDKPKKRRFFSHNLREKLIAVVISLMLWFVHIYGSKVVYKTFMVPVEFAGTNSQIGKLASDPSEIEVSFSGPRRAIYFLGKNSVRLILKPDLDNEQQTLRIANSNFNFPDNVELESIEPRKVTVKVESGAAPLAPQGKLMHQKTSGS